MPIKFEIDYPNDLAKFTLTGAVAYKDALEFLDAYFKTGILSFEIIDVRGTVRKFTVKQKNQIVEWLEAHAVSRPAGSKSAFVVPLDSDHETARFFHLLIKFNRACWQPKMVRSLFEAYEWLDLPMEGS